jgi:hypothetical protein
MHIQLTKEGGGKILVVQVSRKGEQADYRFFVSPFERIAYLFG